MTEPYVSPNDPHWGFSTSREVFIWLYDKTVHELMCGNEETAEILSLTLRDNPCIPPLYRACFNQILGILVPSAAKDCAAKALEDLEEAGWTAATLEAIEPEDSHYPLIHLHTWAVLTTNEEDSDDHSSQESASEK